jgi:hypothetical protein
MAPIMPTKAALVLVFVFVLVMQKPVDAQPSSSRNPGGNSGPPARCFVRNCVTCDAMVPTTCVQCKNGYQLTGPSNTCDSCQPGWEQNLKAGQFVCTKCPTGSASVGGTGEESLCYRITATTARRLFQADEDQWA